MRILILLLLPFYACGNKQNETLTNFKKDVIEDIQISFSESKDSIFCGKYFFNVDERLKKYRCESIYYDDESKVIFLLNSEKVVVFDICLNKKKIEIGIDTSSFHGFFKLGSRYFIGLQCEDCEDVEIWEFEFELERLEVVDLSISQLGDKIPIYPPHLQE